MSDKIKLPSANQWGTLFLVTAQADTQARFFAGPYQRRLIPVVGHNLPQEAPKETAALNFCAAPQHN
jgi:hypothetical protein